MLFIGFFIIMMVLFIGGTWWCLNKINDSKTPEAGWAYVLLLIVFVVFMIIVREVGTTLIMG